MKVFCVHVGCRYEGGSTRAIFSDFENAVRWCRNYANKNGRKWKRVSIKEWDYMKMDVMIIIEKKVW